MADTSYPRYTVEPHIREVLAERFGQQFSSQQLTLVSGGRHEFDAVSADGQIVAGIKTAGGLTRSGRMPAGKIKDSIAELYYLTLVEAQRRMLILVSEEFHRIFLSAMSGRLADGLEVELIVLPPEMQQEVDRIRTQASREVSPSG